MNEWVWSNFRFASIFAFAFSFLFLLSGLFIFLSFIFLFNFFLLFFHILCLLFLFFWFLFSFAFSFFLFRLRFVFFPFFFWLSRHLFDIVLFFPSFHSFIKVLFLLFELSLELILQFWIYCVPKSFDFLIFIRIIFQFFELHDSKLEIGRTWLFWFMLHSLLLSEHNSIQIYVFKYNVIQKIYLLEYWNGKLELLFYLSIDFIKILKWWMSESDQILDLPPSLPLLFPFYSF